MLTFLMWRKKVVTAVPAAMWLFVLLLATFPYGGHYFVDLLGGSIVATTWFTMSRWIECKNGRGESQLWVES